MDPDVLRDLQQTLQRKAIKAMLAEWERKHPGRIDNVFRGLTDVRPSQLADRTLFDFTGFGSTPTMSSPRARPKNSRSERGVMSWYSGPFSGRYPSFVTA